MYFPLSRANEMKSAPKWTRNLIDCVPALEVILRPGGNLSLSVLKIATSDAGSSRQSTTVCQYRTKLGNLAVSVANQDADVTFPLCLPGMLVLIT